MRVWLCALLVLAIGSPIRVALAQPAPAAPPDQPVPPPAPPAPSKPDLELARVFYEQAETALSEGRFGDAVRDYAKAYDLTKDPALLFKLGSAEAQGGHCEAARGYFDRYVKDGKPAAHYIALTEKRLESCEHPDKPSPSPNTNANTTTPPPTDTTTADTTNTTDPTNAGSGTDTSTTPPPQLGRHRAAWLLVGGGIAAATAGAVLAYSASASERDIEDLYVGLGGIPPTFDASTQKKYDDLVAEGRRFEHLSWASFGVAAVLGGLATWRFLADGEGEHARLEVTPSVSPTGPKVSATLRF